MPGLTGRRIQAVAASPTAAATVYVASYGTGVFVTTDAGATWSDFSAGLPTLAIDLTTSSTIYAGTKGSGIFRSVAGGAWTSVDAGVTVAALLPTPLGLYATLKDAGLIVSPDGTTWSATGGFQTGFDADAIAFDPTDPNTMYLGAGADSSGFFKSTNAGATWSPSGNGMTIEDAHYIAVDPVMTSRILVAQNVAN